MVTNDDTLTQTDTYASVRDVATDHRPPTTDHRPPTTDHRPPTRGRGERGRRPEAGTSSRRVVLVPRRHRHDLAVVLVPRGRPQRTSRRPVRLPPRHLPALILLSSSRPLPSSRPHASIPLSIHILPSASITARSRPAPAPSPSNPAKMQAAMISAARPRAAVARAGGYKYVSESVVVYTNRRGMHTRRRSR